MRVSEIGSRLLLGPGPSPVAPRILEAMARPTVGHLDPAFLDLMDDIGARLRDLFGTRNEMTFPVSGTGSAGMEAALANVIEPGDRVVVASNGAFGGRLTAMAARMAAVVSTVEAPWGEILQPGRVLDALDGADVLAIVQAETSTGVWQPVRELGDALRDRPTLLVVDAVTALGGIPVDVDDVGIDVCYAGTQKCLGVPPGLAPITFSPKAMSRIGSRSRPCQSWYLDVALIAEYLGEARRYHHTAPINMLYGLHESLVMLEEEGLDARIARHARAGAALQEGLLERGFTLFAQEGHRLPQLTAAALPNGRDEEPYRRALLERHGIEVAGGLGPARGKIWRIGLMGAGARLENVGRLLEAIDDVLA